MRIIKRNQQKVIINSKTISKTEVENNNFFLALVIESDLMDIVNTKLKNKISADTDDIPMFLIKRVSNIIVCQLSIQLTCLLHQDFFLY